MVSLSLMSRVVLRDPLLVVLRDPLLVIIIVPLIYVWIGWLGLSL